MGTPILATMPLMASQTRGWGLILLGVALYTDPGLFAGLLIVGGILLLPGK